MEIFAVVGQSQTGKTRLIKKLVSELKKGGYSVAVIKHCPHGFDLDTRGKDSWQFLSSGSTKVGMISPGQMAIIQKRKGHVNIRTLAEKHFQEFDFILVEGGKKWKDLKKIEILRKGVSENLECSKAELMAVVADMDVDVDKPVYHPDQIEKIVRFLVSEKGRRGPRTSLSVDGTPIPLNQFVQHFFQKTILGMIGSLKDIDKNPNHITLSIERIKAKDEESE
jgi:molybdopterin-guanine dinucleotide biosynthesis protein B